MPFAAEAAAETTAAEIDAWLADAKATERNEPERALELSQQALTAARRLELQRREARALERAATAHRHLANYERAFELFAEALRLARRLDDRAVIAGAENGLGTIHYFWGAWDQALEHYQRSLSLRRALDDETGVATALNNLGAVSEASGQRAEALDYYAESLELYRRLGDRVLEASSHNNIGLAHYRGEDFATAQVHFEQAHEIADEAGDLLGVAQAETHLGLVHFAAGRLDAARRAFQRSLDLRRDLGDRQGIAVCLHNLGVLAREEGEPVDAIESLERALELALRLDIPQLVRDTYLELSRLREDTGDLVGALADYRAFKDVEDRLFSEAAARQLAHARARFELDAKDRQIEQLEQRRQRQRQERTALLVFSLLLLAILLLLFSRYRLKVRGHREIQSKNEALETAQDELERATRAEVAHLGRVASLGELTAAVAHELNQPLAAILTNAQVAESLLAESRAAEPRAAEPLAAGSQAAEAQAAEVRSMSPRPAADQADVAEAVHDIVVGSRRAWELLDHLRKLARRGEIVLERLDLRDLVRDVEGLLATESRLHEVDFGLDLPLEALPVEADAVQLQQVVLNLVQNALRAATDGEVESGRPWVRVVACRRADEAVLTVEDSGSGADDEVLARMFEPFYTTAADGLGMGLAICRRLVQAHGGDTFAERRAAGGLAVGFRLPLAAVD
ncbi:MAG: tetratricopeptide repeat protein [Acidobacteriota bacterium]